MRSFAGLLGAVLLAASGRADGPGGPAVGTTPEYQVKAAFLYNFLKLTQWPQAALTNHEPLVIGIVGQDPFGQALPKTIGARRIEGRPVVVRYFASFDRDTRCHLLYVGLRDSADRDEVLQHCAGRPILTVADDLAFAQNGGMIAMLYAEGRVRLIVNRLAVQRTGLRLSSRLLQLATLIAPETPPRE